MIKAEMKNDPKNEKKPEDILDKMATGKLSKFFKENCLVEQDFIKDSSMTVEKYVKDAILSIYKQTYPNIELVIIDDCGNDKSMNIVQSLVNAVPNHIKIIISHHPNNKGLSCARNTGIDISTGEFICFFDSDDILPPEAISDLYNTLIQTGAEMSCARKQRFSLNPEITLTNNTANDRIKIYNSNADIIKAYYSKNIDVVAPNRLISRNHIINYNLQFEPDILHEDELWSFFLIRTLKSIAVLDKICYYHRISEHSITRDYGTKNINSILIISDIIYNEMKCTGLNITILMWLLSMEHTAIANAVNNLSRKEVTRYIEHLRNTQLETNKAISKVKELSKHLNYYMLYRSPKVLCYLYYYFRYHK